MSEAETDNADSLESETSLDESAAHTMMQALARGFQANMGGGTTVSTTPSAALFQKGTEILGPELGAFAGSATRGKWVEQMLVSECSTARTAVQLLDRPVNKRNHPRLREEIDWIEEYGDKTNLAVRTLLSELYMAVGEQEKAEEEYRSALRMQRETCPEVAIMQ
ncbi:hypothetical protein HOF56_04790 [Candidatus Peribacteria bacterium]|nr:hypothetical protein [Candidatus Peribacteria bacterium]MBT4021538.1 hypothetical protein [Candidatus Peribacteria bacterium]MBT4240638.1 hypothetical protein [Candidatus Peribacteria bacterium]